MVIYGDVLFLINFTINYILLTATAKLGRLKPRRWRKMLGAALGAVYAVLVFFPNLHLGTSAAAKLLLSLAVVALTFNVCGIRLYLKTVGIFYFVTFCMGGGTAALFYFTDVGAALGAVVKNGVLYMQLQWEWLLVGVGATYALLRTVWHTLQGRLSKENMYVKVCIAYNGREVWLDALLDTGNALCDPLSQTPVIVAEYEKLLPILPPHIATSMENAELPTDTRLRLIPFSSLGREHGMLVGFRPDSAAVLENEVLRDLGRVIIGIYDKPLARDRSYAALLHPALLS